MLKKYFDTFGHHFDYFRPNLWSFSIDRMVKLLERPQKLFLLGITKLQLQLYFAFKSNFHKIINEYITRFIMIRYVKTENARDRKPILF